jgi:hypothetical protein
MFKILFYHANDCLVTNNQSIIYLGIASLYLKTHIETTNFEIGKQIQWLLPLQKKLSDAELIEYCNTVKPDLLCTSHYIWNHSFLIEQLSRIKKFIPKETKIASGGPSIDVNMNQSFFQDDPFIDFAMYGAGEQAFSDLVTSLITGKKLIKFNTSNLAWFDNEKNRTEVADFKYIPQHKVSPFLHNSEMFSEMVKDMQSKNLSVVIPYELTRGCPYSCTFCDWNSGLSNKVTRRKGTYQDEIDFFQKLKIKNIYLADANVGQYEEDIEMISYFADKNLNEHAGFILDGNYSKLRKENNLKIYKLMGQSNLVSEYGGFTISVQDINQDVLKNIDRPDVGWQTHLAMINELNKSFPDKSCKVQIIQGLPGQTVESWRETLSEICKHDLTIQPFVSELLPTSPAARDKIYQEKFEFVYSKSERYEAGIFIRGIIPQSCISFTQYDFAKMTILTIFYTTLLYFKKQSPFKFNIEDVVDSFLVSETYDILLDNLYTNWTLKDKFYFTLNLDLQPMAVSSSNFYESSAYWFKSFFLLKLVSAHVNEKPTKFLKEVLNVKNNKFESKIRRLEGYT